jgi:hypothetical protein
MKRWRVLGIMADTLISMEVRGGTGVTPVASAVPLLNGAGIKTAIAHH